MERIVKVRKDHMKGSRVSGVADDRQYQADPGTGELHRVANDVVAQKPGCHEDDCREFEQFTGDFAVEKIVAPPKAAAPAPSTFVKPPPPALKPAAVTLPEDPANPLDPDIGPGEAGDVVGEGKIDDAVEVPPDSVESDDGLPPVKEKVAPPPPKGKTKDSAKPPSKKK